MDLTDEIGLQRTVPKIQLWKYGKRKLSSITGYIGKDQAKWIAYSKSDTIIINFKKFTLSVGIGESDFEAEYGEDVMAVAGFQCPFLTFALVPSTQDIIEFFNYKVDEDQVMEFLSY